MQAGLPEQSLEIGEASQERRTEFAAIVGKCRLDLHLMLLGNKQNWTCRGFVPLF
jgi:hypothetical protein